MTEEIKIKAYDFLLSLKKGLILIVLTIVYFIGLAFSIFLALLINRSLLWDKYPEDTRWKEAKDYNQTLEGLKRQS